MDSLVYDKEAEVDHTRLITVNVMCLAIRGETIWIITILHIAFQCIAIYCHIAIHDQTLLKTISWERLVHNYTFSMQLIKAESQRQPLIITFMHLFVILFFNLLQTTQYLAIYCNILQYIDILYWPYCIVL